MYKEKYTSEGKWVFFSKLTFLLISRRCIKISLVHDMAECIVGDLVPADNISKADKHSMEKDAMKRLQGLVSSETGKELYSLWEVGGSNLEMICYHSQCKKIIKTF